MPTDVRFRYTVADRVPDTAVSNDLKWISIKLFETYTSKRKGWIKSSPLSKTYRERPKASRPRRRLSSGGHEAL
jgi:hypothetical protein